MEGCMDGCVVIIKQPSLPYLTHLSTIPSHLYSLSLALAILIACFHLWSCSSNCMSSGTRDGLFCRLVFEIKCFASVALQRVALIMDAGMNSVGSSVASLATENTENTPGSIKNFASFTA